MSDSADSDLQLLARYDRDRAEDAFAEIARRHVDWVYSAALRQVHSPHLAEEIAQSVFADLARDAARIRRAPETAAAEAGTLAPWLHAVTRRTAIDVIRQESRRRHREQTAAEMNALAAHPSDAEARWDDIAPLLDEAVAALEADDRTAILLRYFENQPLREVGRQLGVGEDAAQKRVSRAVERLRDFFARRKIAIGAGGLAALISANAVQAAPAGLAAAILTAGTGALTFSKIMIATKIKLGLGALAVAGAATVMVAQHQTQAQLRTENAALQQQIAQLQADSASLSNRLAASDSRSLPEDQFHELLKLRGEVGVLRQQTNELARLRGADQQLQAAQQNTQVPNQTDYEHGKQVIEYAKQGTLACVLFSNDHPQEALTNMAQLYPYFNNATYFNNANKELIEAQLELAYQGPMNAITNAWKTIVLKEKQPWQTADGKWMKAYGFADGHAEIRTEPENDFSKWESERTFTP